VVQVVLLSLAERETCMCADGACGTRAPALACRDALLAAGAPVDMVVAHSDADIDDVIGKLDGRRLVVAAAADGQLRAVVRRMVRAYAVVPSNRPDDLPLDRTMTDLPPIGVLPLAPGEPRLVTRLGLPAGPADVAAAVLEGSVRRFDLLRTDAGSVTLDGTLLGGTDDTGTAVLFTARVEVDDAVLADGTERLLLAAVANADGYADLDGLHLTPRAEAADGVLDVAVALPARGSRGLLRRPSRPRIEVRRARGRAVTIAPRDTGTGADVPFVDDGVTGALRRRRTWWIERAAWAAYGGVSGRD
jgi:hypothetical protein